MLNTEIEVFLTVERTRSFTKAAELLHMTQPTLSNRLKTLENIIGFTLFQRRKGQKIIRLTPKGEEFLSIAQRWSVLWQEAQALKQHEPQSSLSVGSVDSLNTTILPSLYHKLANHKPKMNLKIVTRTSLELYELIERREVDVGFVLREVNSANVIIEPIFSEPMLAIRHADNVRNNDLINPSRLDRKHEVFFNWSPAFMSWHNRWWDPNELVHVEVDTISLIIAHLDNPQKWGIIPLSMARSNILPDTFVFTEFTDPPPERVCYKIMHRYPHAINTQSLEILNKYLPVIM